MTYRLLNGCIVIEPMALKDIDIVYLQPFEAVLDCVENVLATQAVLVNEANLLWSLKCLIKVLVDVLVDGSVYLRGQSKQGVLSKC